MSGGFQAVWFRILCLSGKTSLRPKGEHPFQDIQRSERCRRAVTLVIVRLPLGQAGTLREDRLRPVGSLNLAFLVHAQNDGFVWRVPIEPHNVPNLRGKVWIVAELEHLAISECLDHSVVKPIRMWGDRWR